MALRDACLSVLLGGAVLSASAPVLLSAHPAHATVAVAMGLDDLVRTAEQVVVADVVASHADWDPRHETIVTTVELVVVESWKGAAAPAKHLTLQQPGGTVGDITMKVSGLSSFTPGERSLLFLRTAGATLTVVGLSQGKRPMELVPMEGAGTTGQASAGGANGPGAATIVNKRWMVREPSLSGLATVKNPSRSGNPGPAVSSAATSASPADVKGAISVDEMRARVRTLLQQQGAK